MGSVSRRYSQCLTKSALLCPVPSPLAFRRRFSEPKTCVKSSSRSRGGCEVAEEGAGRDEGSVCDGSSDGGAMSSSEDGAANSSSFTPVRGFSGGNGEAWTTQPAPTTQFEPTSTMGVTRQRTPNVLCEPIDGDSMPAHFGGQVLDAQQARSCDTHDSPSRRGCCRR